MVLQLELVMPGLSQLDNIIARLGKIDPTAPRVHGGILFDPRRGIGGTPDAANIDYRGFQAYMRPAQFRGLTPPRSHPFDYVRDAIASGEPVGTPVVYVDRKPATWQATGHEGRGRMLSLEGISGDSLFPVGVHPNGEVRSRHLAPEDLFRRLLPERGGSGGLSPDLVIWQQQPYVRPGQEENPSVLRALMEMMPP
ncbi:MAG: hypothetical protein EBT03_07670 [Betaproteobacteria bacterium]|nr:hypothetical protein [Betaproteobacteria bacterium]NCA16962.1 hypothetical protein [Betaproteobacteria bacterium]